MKDLLARFTLGREIGLMIDEHEIAVSLVATTIVGAIELSRETAAYEPDQLAATIERLVKPMLPRKALARVRIASGLLVLLSVILGATWGTFGRPLIDADTRCRLVLEARMVATALAHDVGGCDPSTGTRASGRFVGRICTANNQLRLCFDGGSAPNGVADWGPPDTVVTYSVNNDGPNTALVRLDETSGASFTVARYVTGMSLVELGSGVEVQLTLSYRTLTQTYTLMTIDP